MRKYATFIDGAFAIHKLAKINQPQKFPDSKDILNLIDSIGRHPVIGHKFHLLRTYFYHAHPAKGVIKNPIDKKSTDLSNTKIYHQHSKLISDLELAENIAMRLGESIVSVSQWKLGKRAIEDLGNRQLAANDLVPDIKQKGVDLRIGLDIARLAMKNTVDAIVVVAGDSDLVPVFKFARTEGVQVYLCPLEHGIRREMRVHVDGVLF